MTQDTLSAAPGAPLSPEDPDQVSLPTPEVVEPTAPEATTELEPDTFPREYVETLRAEAKEARLKASRVDTLEAEVRRLAIAAATRGVISDPDSLVWSEDYANEDGLPDPELLAAAAHKVATEKPWLARPRGEVGQGHQAQADAPLSLSALLRA